MDWFRNKNSDTGVVSFCVLTSDFDNDNLRVVFNFDEGEVLTVEPFRRYWVELYDFEECCEEAVPDVVVERVEKFL